MFDFERIIDLPDAKIFFIENFFERNISDLLFKKLKNDVAWAQGEIMMFGKKVLEPRLTAWYGDSGKTYVYSGKKHDPLAWNEPLTFIKNQIETPPQYFEPKNEENQVKMADFFTQKYNSVLCNFYRNGSDSMGWHADNERELGQNPVIASVNFGESRRFLIRKKEDKSQKLEFLLTHGSLLIMSGAMQHHWQHAVPKEPRKQKPRINLTFRFIL